MHSLTCEQFTRARIRFATKVDQTPRMTFVINVQLIIAIHTTYGLLPMLTAANLQHHAETCGLARSNDGHSGEPFMTHGILLAFATKETSSRQYTLCFPKAILDYFRGRAPQSTRPNVVYESEISRSRVLALCAGFKKGRIPCICLLPMFSAKRKNRPGRGRRGVF